MPAITASKVDVVTTLKESGKTESRRSPALRMRAALVVGEIALALMLVYGAALMVSTFRKLSASYPGFRTEHVLTGAVTIPEADYASDSAVVQFWEQLRRSIAEAPGVKAAELTTVLPMTWNEQRARFYPENLRPEKPENIPSAGFRRVSAGYLDALDVQLKKGRTLTPADAQERPAVAVLSESAARRFFPNGDAIGRRIVTRDRAMEVVGIVGDVRGNPLSSDSPLDVVYVPLAQWPARSASVVLDVGQQDPSSFVGTLQSAVARVDARLAAGDVSTMERVVATVTSPQSATSKMLLTAAIIALILATVGTYGVMSYSVARRTHEMGVRLALGADPRRVIGLVVGGSARLAMLGIVLGAIGALGLGRLMAAVLFETSPSDFRVLSVAATLLATVALVAGYLPARRAAATNPMSALRQE
jgi:putative ABC transport system permease protein